MKPVAKAEEDHEPLIDGSDVFRRKFTEHARILPFSSKHRASRGRLSFVEIDQTNGLGSTVPARARRAMIF